MLRALRLLTLAAVIAAAGCGGSEPSSKVIPADPKSSGAKPGALPAAPPPPRR